MWNCTRTISKLKISKQIKISKIFISRPIFISFELSLWGTIPQLVHNTIQQITQKWKKWIYAVLSQSHRYAKGKKISLPLPFDTKSSKRSFIVGNDALSTSSVTNSVTLFRYTLLEQKRVEQQCHHHSNRFLKNSTLLLI